MMRRSLVTLLLLAAPGLSAAAEPSPGFVDSGGQLRRGEHAIALYLDAELLLPPLTLAYRHGVFDWWEIGVDAGGMVGLFQAVVHTKLRLLESRDRRFYWGLRFRAGYKCHHFNIGEALVFDDDSWVLAAENAVALRLGQRRDRALYLSTVYYADLDRRTPKRQTDHYVVPASLGFESMFWRRWSWFAELALGLSVNGTEADGEVLYKGALFPMGQVGVSVRF